LIASSSQEIIKEHTYVPESYGEELRRWENAGFRAQQTHSFQLPFPPDAVPSPEDLREKAARRQEQSRRMKELVRARTQERVSAAPRGRADVKGYEWVE